MDISNPRPPEASTRTVPGHGASGERRGPGAAVLLLLVPALCCGGPAIAAALAAASAATLGVVGGVLGAALAAAALGLWVRHRHRASACCARPERAWRA